MEPIAVRWAPVVAGEVSGEVLSHVSARIQFSELSQACDQPGAILPDSQTQSETRRYPRKLDLKSARFTCNGQRSPGIRWQIEKCNEQGKDLLGLDQHQVRAWTAFHHHVAVCLFAHAATRRAHQQTLAATRRVLAAHAGDQTGEGAHRGKQPGPRHRSKAETLPRWRVLSTVADILALLAERLRPLHDRPHKARWILWRRIHRAPAGSPGRPGISARGLPQIRA